MPTLLRWLERYCWLAAFLALGSCTFYLLESATYQAYLGRRLDQIRRSRDGAAGSPALPARGSVVARLEIPRIGLTAMVLEGADPEMLRLGVGHLPGTAFPGQPGNVVLAAHRDTFFHPLQQIREHDAIVVTALQGTHRYRVESTAVVDPDSVGVLHASFRRTLTLITCHPFDYIGPAPRRFVVQARETAHGPLPARPPHRAKPDNSLTLTALRLPFPVAPVGSSKAHLGGTP